MRERCGSFTVMREDAVPGRRRVASFKGKEIERTRCQEGDACFSWRKGGDRTRCQEGDAYLSLREERRKRGRGARKATRI